MFRYVFSMSMRPSSSFRMSSFSRSYSAPCLSTAVGSAQAAFLLPRQQEYPAQLFFLRGLQPGRLRVSNAPGFGELRVAVRALRRVDGVDRVADRTEDRRHGRLERLSAAG